MKHKIIRVMAAAFLLLMFSPDLAVTVYAGSINSAEQKVIAAVSGTFTYQGKTYAVKSQYIAEGKSKLAEDGIDLSDDDANAYIIQFRNSYAELIEGGYCEEVGGMSGEQTSERKDKDDQKENIDPVKLVEGQDNKSFDTDSQKASVDDRNGGSGHSPAEKAKNELFIKTVLGETDSDSESDFGTATQVPSENAADAEWLEEEDLGTAMDFDDADLAAAKEQTLLISESGNRYQIHAQKGKGQEQRKENNILDQILHLNQWKILSCVVLGLTFCSIAAISCYIWKVRKKHHKKRKLRLGLAVAAGVSIAGCTFLLMFVMGLYFGIYNKEAIHRQLMESDYYSGITQMTRRLAGERLQKAGCDEKIAVEVFSLSHVYIEEKQYIDAILSGKKKCEISVEVIENALTEQIPDSLGENKTVLIREITDLYQNTLQFEMGKMIRENRQEFLPWCYAVAGISSLLLLILFILIYVMYGYLHKSVRVGAAGIFVSSLLLAGISLVMRLRHYAGRFHAEPVYYQQFVQKYVNWSVNVMFYVGCIGLLSAVALTVWKKYLHMMYVE